MSALALDGTLPRSRSTDPITSVDAGRYADLNESQRDVLAIFHIAAKPLALHELTALARDLGLKRTEQRVRSACAELVDRGLVVMVEGVYRKTETGHNAHVWKLAEAPEC